MNTMSNGMELDEEMISVSPIFKSTPNNSNNNNNIRTNDGSSFDGANSPPSVFGNAPPSVVRHPTLQHQHSYAGHEESFNNDNTVGFVSRAPSGRPFLTTRHLSIEDRSNENNINNNETENSPVFPTNAWSHQNHHLSAIRNPPHNQHLFRSPVEETQERQPAPSSPSSPAASSSSSQQEETAEDRARREEEESVALAQMLMAEEAMASHRMSADFLRMNSAQFSAEDFAALQNALQEEEVEYDEEEEEQEEVAEDMSYDALLRLGERIGDVKTDRWTMIAHKEIAKLETFQFDPSVHENKDGEDAKMEDVDDSEIKCLVCQFTYEKGDELRRLPCGHCFHKDCVDQWLQTKDCCAYCRQCILPEKEDEKKSNAEN